MLWSNPWHARALTGASLFLSIIVGRYNVCIESIQAPSVTVSQLADLWCRRGGLDPRSDIAWAESLSSGFPLARLW